MLAGTRKIIDGVTCNATATVYSKSLQDNPAQATNSWIDASYGEAFSVWVNVSSATGTGNVTVYADLSPLSPKGHGMAYDATTTQYYTAFTLGTVTSDNVLAMFSAADLGKYNLDYPFVSMRIRVTGTGSNPTDTVVTAYLVVASTRV